MPRRCSGTTGHRWRRKRRYTDNDALASSLFEQQAAPPIALPIALSLYCSLYRSLSIALSIILSIAVSIALSRSLSDDGCNALASSLFEQQVLL